MCFNTSRLNVFAPPTTQHALANTIPGDPVELHEADCPSCGPDRPIRLYLDRRQCGGCGFLIARGDYFVRDDE